MVSVLLTLKIQILTKISVGIYGSIDDKNNSLNMKKKICAYKNYESIDYNNNSLNMMEEYKFIGVDANRHLQFFFMFVT